MAPEKERRRFPRVKVAIPLELRFAGGTAPLRVTTNEISLSGCYVETMFTVDVGTQLTMVFWLGDQKVSAKGVVATRYPQVGNGIDILEMSPADRSKLEQFLAVSVH
jgi:hypothetical protein